MITCKPQALSFNSNRSTDNPDTTTVCTVRNNSVNRHHCSTVEVRCYLVLPSWTPYRLPLSSQVRWMCFNAEKNVHTWCIVQYATTTLLSAANKYKLCTCVYAPRLQLVRTFYCSSYSRDRAVNRTRTNRLGIDTYTARMHCLHNGASVLLHRMHRPMQLRTQSAQRPQFVAYI